MKNEQPDFFAQDKKYCELQKEKEKSEGILKQLIKQIYEQTDILRQKTSFNEELNDEIGIDISMLEVYAAQAEAALEFKENRPPLRY